MPFDLIYILNLYENWNANSFKFIKMKPKYCVIQLLLYQQPILTEYLLLVESNAGLVFILLL